MALVLTQALDAINGWSGYENLTASLPSGIQQNGLSFRSQFLGCTQLHKLPSLNTQSCIWHLFVVWFSAFWAVLVVGQAGQQ